MIKITLKNVFFGIIILGILARIFYFIVIPEGTYNDTLYHINVIKEVIEKQSFDLTQIDVPPPFYYSLFVSFFTLSLLDLNLFTLKIFPFAIEALYFVFAFFVLRKIFKEKYYVPLAFFSIFPWSVRFSGINYIENLSIIFVLSTFYFLLDLMEKKNVRLFSLFPIIFSISALSLSKLNATILVPIFFLTTIFFLVKNNTKLLTITIFSIFVIFLSSFWFINNFFIFGVFDQHIKSDVFDIGSSTGFSVESIVSNLQFYFVYFFDFPNESAFSTGGFLYEFDFFILSIIFTLMVLPIFFTILFGFKKMIFEKQILNFTIIALILISFIPVIQRVAYYRLIIPVTPLIAIVFAKGFLELKNSKLKSIVMVSFVLFSFYSIALTSISGVAFGDVYSKHNNLFNELSDLDDDSLILINSNMQRHVSVLSNQNAFGLAPDEKILNVQSANSFYESIKEFGITHIAKTCFKDPLNQEFVFQLEQKGQLIKTFSDSCSEIYEVK